MEDLIKSWLSNSFGNSQGLHVKGAQLLMGRTIVAARYMAGDQVYVILQSEHAEALSKFLCGSNIHVIVLTPQKTEVFFRLFDMEYGLLCENRPGQTADGMILETALNAFGHYQIPYPNRYAKVVAIPDLSRQERMFFSFHDIYIPKQFRYCLFNGENQSLKIPIELKGSRIISYSDMNIFTHEEDAIAAQMGSEDSRIIDLGDLF